jgi:uncharacterized membrane protein
MMLRHSEELIQSTATPAVSATGHPVRLIHIALLAVILLGGTLLRVHALGKTSFWYDEICSVLYARGQTAAIFDAPQGYFDHAPALASRPGMRGWSHVWFGFDTTPPLYPTLLRLWWPLFGDGDIADRSLSVVLSVAAIAALFDFGRLMMSPASALWACALCAASPSMVRYAQEARAYALICLLGILICDVTFRIKKFGGNPRRYLLLGLLCALALLTHNFIVGGIAAVVVYAILTLRGRARIAVVCVIAAGCLVELWEVPILLHHSQYLRQGIDWTAESPDGLLLTTILRITWLPVVYLILPPNDPGILSIPAIVVFILPLFFWKQRPGLLLAGLWSIGIVGLVAASDLWLDHGALLYTRYTLAAAPMVFITVVAIADLGGRWTRHGLPALTLIGAMIAVPQAYDDQTWIKPEIKELARDVRTHVQPGDVLVVVSNPIMGLYSARNQYLGIDFYAGPLPYAAAVLEAPIDPAEQQQIWAHKHVWMVVSWGGSNHLGQIDPVSYLGPCHLTPAGDVHLFAGRLFLASQQK